MASAFNAQSDPDVGDVYKRQDGYYEIISGHRRMHAAEKLGYRKVPVIIRVLSEDDSILSIIDFIIS